MKPYTYHFSIANYSSRSGEVTHSVLLGVCSGAVGAVGRAEV